MERLWYMAEKMSIFIQNLPKLDTHTHMFHKPSQEAIGFFANLAQELTSPLGTDIFPAVAAIFHAVDAGPVSRTEHEVSFGTFLPICCGDAGLHVGVASGLGWVGAVVRTSTTPVLKKGFAFSRST